MCPLEAGTAVRCMQGWCLRAGAHKPHGAKSGRVSVAAPDPPSVADGNRGRLSDKNLVCKETPPKYQCPSLKPASAVDTNWVVACGHSGTVAHCFKWMQFPVDPPIPAKVNTRLTSASRDGSLFRNIYTSLPEGIVIFIRPNGIKRSI